MAAMFMQALASACRRAAFGRCGEEHGGPDDGDPDKGRPNRNGSLPSQIAARTFSAANRPLPAWVGLLAMLEDFASTWDHDQDAPDREFADVLISFGWRCSAPGCTSRRNLQVHHVVYRSHGGGDERENLVVLCLFHHLRGEHGDFAECRGRSPLGVTWRLGRKRFGEFYRNERRIDPLRAPAPLRSLIPASLCADRAGAIH